MKTSLLWQEEPEDWEGLGRFPETHFDCGRLEVGDQLIFFIDLPDGGSQEYCAEVVKVEYMLSWDSTEEIEPPISVIQWVYIKG